MPKQRNAWHTVNVGKGVKDGKGWAVKRAGSQRASSRHATQRAAVNAAKKVARNQGGGEVVIHRKDGSIRDKDTVAPGNDPYPPKDTKH